MKSIAIKGSKRENLGKKSSKALRDAGKVPCVLYGGKEIVHFSAPELDFRNLVYTSDVHTVKLNIDGKTTNAVLQDIQFHPVTDHILHMDFYQFEDDQPIRMTLPVHTTGLARGVRAGGVLQVNLRRLDLRGLVSNLPDFIEVDVTSLRIGHKIPVESLLSDDYEILHENDEVICQVIAPRNVEVSDDDEDEEEGAEAAPAAEEAPAEE